MQKEKPWTSEVGPYRDIARSRRKELAAASPIFSDSATFSPLSDDLNKGGQRPSEYYKDMLQLSAGHVYPMVVAAEEQVLTTREARGKKAYDDARQYLSALLVNEVGPHHANCSVASWCDALDREKSGITR